MGRNNHLEHNNNIWKYHIRFIFSPLKMLFNLNGFKKNVKQSNSETNSRQVTVLTAI